MGCLSLEIDELAAQELAHAETRRVLKIKHQQMIQRMIDCGELPYMDVEIYQKLVYIISTFPDVNSICDIRNAYKLISDDNYYDIAHYLWKMVDDGILSFKSTGKQFELIEK
jgi:hypothetical protein